MREGSFGPRAAQRDQQRTIRLWSTSFVRAVADLDRPRIRTLALVLRAHLAAARKRSEWTDLPERLARIESEFDRLCRRQGPRAAAETPWAASHADLLCRVLGLIEGHRRAASLLRRVLLALDRGPGLESDSDLRAAGGLLSHLVLRHFSAEGELFGRHALWKDLGEVRRVPDGFHQPAPPRARALR